MNVMVIDTETANSIEQPMPYDIGYVIVDITTGRILEKKSFVVAEIFLDKDLMKEAYFAEKIPQYWKDIKDKKRVMKGIWNIRKIIHGDLKKYSITKVGAYNMAFDKRATRNDIRYLTGSMLRWFFPYGIEFFCIWSMACSSILKTKDFVEYARKNNFISEKGNIKTSAEICYRYITKNNNFTEDHTGLADTLIETEILLTILKSGLPFESDIHYGCWRWVQKIA